VSTMTLTDRERQLDAYDLSFVHERAETEGLFEGEDVPRIEQEFRNFMKLVLSEVGPLAVIDRRVDEFWHSFILFTPQYQTFCRNVIGFFVHHQPRTSTTPVPQLAVTNFVEAYRKRFGKLDSFWLERLEPTFQKQILAGMVPVSSGFKWSGWTGRLE
jgi:hypothetical protein